MNIHRWIHAGVALPLFIIPGLQAQGQEQVVSEAIAPQTQPPEATNALVLPALVRLTMTDGSEMTVEMLRVEPGRITFRASNAKPREIPFSTVKRVEVSRGKGRWKEVPVSSFPVTPLALPARVQLGITDGTRLKGELVRLEEGRVIVRTDASPPVAERAIPLADVKRAKIGIGNRGHAGRGALIGLGSSVALAFAIPCDGDGCILNLLFLPTGTLLGTVMGALHKTDRWEDIPVSSLRPASPPVKADEERAETSPDRQMRIAIAPTIDRCVQARFSISWR